MPDQFSRTALLLGQEAMNKLKLSKVAIFGLGGVGSYAAEALARAGVGALDLIDDDTVCPTNINRQLIAAHSTIGRPKTEVMEQRLADINPSLNITAHACFFNDGSTHLFDFSRYSYVIDAIDTISSKLLLIECAVKSGTPIISCMGAGNKLDPTRFEVDDIYNTSVCPLAKVMRRELRKRGVERLKVVYSKETPRKPAGDTVESSGHGGAQPSGPERTRPFKRQVPGSVSFVPPVAGLILAGEVVKQIACICGA